MLNEPTPEDGTLADFGVPYSGTGLRQRPGDQPLPTEGQEDVQAALIREIEARRELGKQRYGRPLQTFNGRDALRDLLDELLDGATYAMQVRMEIAARQDRVDRALAEHHADWEGNCTTCKVSSPCTTRRILTGQPAQPNNELTVKTTHPVEEVAVHPDSLNAFRAKFRVQEAERRLGAPLLPGELFGFPVVCDESIPPGVVRLRPLGFDNHPSHGTKEPS